jgi:hypothetical protein
MIISEIKEPKIKENMNLNKNVENRWNAVLAYFQIVQ